jgi:hypothetical protein
MWTDSRVHRIYAGTNEILKELIATTPQVEEQAILPVRDPIRTGRIACPPHTP